jgi:uncharacterized secreted protein with C-terminal beta-propeller domain
MRRRPRLMATGAGLATLVGAATAGGWALSGPGLPAAAPAGPGRHAPAPVPRGARLVAYDSCTQLLGQLRAQALRELSAQAAPEGALSGLPGAAASSATGSVVSPPAVFLPSTLLAPPAPASGVTAGGAAAGGAAAGGAAAGGTASPDAAAGGASPGAVSPGAAPTFSTTNDQEPGVDEPDLAKTDGHLLVALRRASDTLEVVSVSGAPGLVGSLALGGVVDATGLFLVGNDVVVLGSAASSAASPPAPPTPIPPAASAPPPSPASVAGGPAGVVAVASPAQDTEVAVVDVSDPVHPAVVRSFALQGALVDARLISGVVEVVVASSPTLPFVVPASGTASDAAAALSADRLAVERSTVSQWLPSVTSEPSGTTTTAACTSAMHSTAGATGLDTIGVVPIDPSSDQPGPEATVVGDASAVYASATKLYVAYSGTPTPTPPGGPLTPVPSSSQSTVIDNQSTVIDAFDLSKPENPTYLGTGVVAGALLGPYAMSEYQGDLRVATTVGTPTPAPEDGSAPAALSDNRVTVLALEAGTLAQVGQVGGLGAGEQIYAVRFEGPLGFVVTFHQTDPLYVVDLSDPAHPALAGQLALSGYSSFLEPLGSGLLLGVGQEVDSALRTDGLQVSLFDVSDPTAPVLLDKAVVPDASSSAETDPHALLYWAPDSLVVMPVDEWGASGPFAGALAFELRGHSLGSAVPIGQPPSPAGASGGTGPVAGAAGVAGTSVAGPASEELAPSPEVERALVVGDMLYTVSESGILASDLSTLAPASWLPWS